MKEYIKPEVEVIDFATEAIADQGTTGGSTGTGGAGTLPG